MTRALLAAALVAITARAAAADCVPKLARHEVAAQVVYLGDYADLLGHHASWFWDPVQEVVIGPLDRDPWPGGHARVVPVTTAAPGDSGVVHAVVWVDDPAHLGGAGGWFTSFAPDGQHAELLPIVKAIGDPFVVGLLAGAPATTKLAYDVAAHTLRGRSIPDAAHTIAGLLDTAATADAQRLMGSFRLRMFGGADPHTVLAMRDGPAALAKLDPLAAPVDWTDYLPILALAKSADLQTALDDAMLGHTTPQLPPAAAPPTPAPAPPSPTRCEPARELVRGPSLVGELAAPDVLAIFRAHSPQLAPRVLAAFDHVVAGSGYVVGLHADGAKRIAVIAVPGALPTALALTAAQATGVELGTRLEYVARAAPRPTFGHAQLDAAASPIELHAATRVRVGSIDVAAALAALQAETRSAQPTTMAIAVTTLLEVGDHVPGWSRADARAFVWSLPGPTYDTPEQWAAAWHGALAQAITLAPDTFVADEAERALPVLFTRFTDRTHARIAANVVRSFASELESAIALRRLAAGDIGGAHAAAERAAGSLDAFTGGAPLGPSTDADRSWELEVQALGVLCDTLAQDSPILLPAPEDRAHALALLREMMRPYAPALRDRWLHTLAGAGLSGK